MNKVFYVWDKINNNKLTTKTCWIYKTLGEAKTAVRNYVSFKNKKKSNEKLKWENFEVIECEPIELVRHKI